MFLFSNLWWFYWSLDTGVTQAYLKTNLDRHEKALQQALSLLAIAARPNVSPAEMIDAASLPEDQSPPFEKDGYIWVGEIGLKFSEDGKLLAAATAWKTQ